MKYKILLIILVLALSTVACNLPSLTQKTAVPEAVPTLDNGMVLYDGIGLQLMLPPSYIAKDINEDLPGIVNFLQSVLGDSNPTIKTFIDNLEGNVAWWGYDSAAPAISPTKLLIIRNEQLAGLPVYTIGTAVGLFLGDDANSLDTDKVDLGGREITRLTFSKDSNGWAGYVFKEQDLLWLVLFLTTPSNLAAQQTNFEYSVGSIVLDPPAVPQP